MLLHSF